MIRFFRRLFTKKRKPAPYDGKCSLCKNDIFGEPAQLKIKTYDGVLDMKLCKECEEFMNTQYMRFKNENT